MKFIESIFPISKQRDNYKKYKRGFISAFNAVKQVISQISKLMKISMIATITERNLLF